MDLKTAGVVVTFNRKEMLLNNIKSLLSQDKSLSKIIIIDNASTDGTFLYLEENGILELESIDYVRLEVNSGGAGGFYEGVKKGYEEGYDYLWLMDDDGAPDDEKAFANIMEKALEFKENGEELFVLNSLVVCDKEQLSFGLGGARGSESFMEKRVEACDRAKDGIIYNTLNPFNGTLVTRELIGIVGYPNKEFFIKGDDTEYLLRCKKAKGILATVVNSVYYHPSLPLVRYKSFGKEKTISSEAPWKEYYRTRNHTRMFIERKKYKEIVKLIGQRLTAMMVGKEKKVKTMQMIFKGLRHGLQGKMGKRVLP